MDAERMLLRISGGDKLSPEESSEIGRALREFVNAPAGESELTPDDVYSLVLIVGRAKAYEQRHLLEEFLAERDPLTAALALQILCLEWDYVDDYLDRLVDFSLGVSWDHDHDVKQEALKIVGEHLHCALNLDLNRARRKKSGGDRALLRQMLQLLNDTFFDEQAPDWVRKTAYFSLCRSMGQEWEKLPSECQQLDFSPGSPDIDWEIIKRVQESLSSSDEFAATSGVSGARAGVSPAV